MSHASVGDLGSATDELSLLSPMLNDEMATTGDSLVPLRPEPAEEGIQAAHAAPAPLSLSATT